METKNKKYVIMCVGHTHSGKTIFAKELVKKYPNTIQIDSDEIAVFTREKYPLVVTSAYNKNRPDFKNLKITLFSDVYDFSLNAGFNIILSNGNIAQKMRSFVSRQARKYDYTLVTVYFNLPHEVILERLKNTTKSTNVLLQSKSWIESFERQKNYAQLPPSKRNTIYFEIQKDADKEFVMKEIGKLI